MATVMSPVLDTNLPPATSETMSSPSSNPNHPPLPPLITSPPARRSNLQRPPSHASKNRLSQYSNNSGPSRSRPPSHIFPAFHSSLSYTIVRDFAYQPLHPMHYGPPLEPSGLSTPASEAPIRLSDPPTSWDSRGGWGTGPSASESQFNVREQLAPIHFGDGPPWSEDEDLQSPVVSSPRRRHRNSSGPLGRGRGRNRRDDNERTTSMLSQENFEQDRGYFAGTTGDGSERYYVSYGDEAGGPGGEYVTYPPAQARHSSLALPSNTPGQRDSHFAGALPKRSYTDDNGNERQLDSDASSPVSSPGLTRQDQSRYSRDYQFTIASPDEEMHGKAVALFDFERENENELPLVEGQVILVSYRHGQGWLVAEDPKTQESGLVPEEYVRLLRDIQGGLNSLTSQANDQLLSPVAPDFGTPTQADHSQSFGTASAPSNGANGYQQPVVSTFSMSSKDLHPYPQHLLGTQAGQAPPQVVHYHGQRGGSQANTPTISSSIEGSRDCASNQDAKTRKAESSSTTPIATALPHELPSPSPAVQQPESPDSDTVEESSGDEKRAQVS